VTGISPEELFEAWFGNSAPVVIDAEVRTRWFKADPSFDALLAGRFRSLLDAILTTGTSPWPRTAASELACILACDQFPRNIHRGSGQAYAWDAIALRHAHSGIRDGFDRALPHDGRLFFCMPFMHSEDLVDQHTSVGLFTLLHDDSPDGFRQQSEASLKEARRHRDIVLRFGRFPHRNAALGRASTAEETAWLQTASRFGQA